MASSSSAASSTAQPLNSGEFISDSYMRAPHSSLQTFTATPQRRASISKSPTSTAPSIILTPPTAATSMKATQTSAMQWPSSPPSLLRGRTNVPPVQSQRRMYSDSNDMGEAPHAASPVVQGPNHLTFNRINSYGGQSFNGLKNGTLSRSRSPATHGQSLIS